MDTASHSSGGTPAIRWEEPPAALPSAGVQAFAWLADLPSRRANELEALLSPEERERAARYRFEADRVRYVVGRAHLRQVVGEILGHDPRSVTIEADANGKPTLAGPAPPLRFNVSGSHGVGVLAVDASADVGVDVELVRPVPEALRLAERFFAPEEARRLRAAEPSGLPAAFFDLWTRKEALVKSIGRGIRHGLDGFAIPADADAGSGAAAVDLGPPYGDRWVVALPPPREGYVAALAAAGEPRPVAYWGWPRG